MKVLMPDDDRELVDLLTYALGQKGLTLLPAYDPPMAWRAR